MAIKFHCSQAEYLNQTKKKKVQWKDICHLNNFRKTSGCWRIFGKKKKKGKTNSSNNNNNKKKLNFGNQIIYK